MKKRIASIALCLAMSLSLLPTAAMASARFTDVPESLWCYADVELAVREGLVNGTSPTTYSPDSNLTYSAAIKLAACMHKRVTTGSADFTASDPWYKVYVDYARANGIVTKDYPLTEAATRAGYMEIFARAIPDTGLQSGYKALAAMNRVDEGTIPDVPADHPQAEAIYKLYRAGILQGSDAAHNCSPSSSITRGAVAAILARIMDPSKRISFEMVGDAGMTVTEQPADVDYTAANGRAVFATAVTGGKGPYTYKWFSSGDDGATWNAIVNNSKYSGVSTQKLTVKLDAADSISGTRYRCQITDAAGHLVTTRSARISAASTPLTVVDQPMDVAARSGDEVSFSTFAAGGKAPIAYQWQRKAQDGSWQDFPIRNSGYETSTTNTLILTASDVDFAAGYTYRCKITDAAGATVCSQAAALKKSASTLAVVEHPQDVTCSVGDWVDFGVTVSGGKAPYTYQWQMTRDEYANWSDLSNNSVLTGTNTAELRAQVEEMDFQYGFQCRCKITDGNGDTVYSNTASFVKKQSGTRPIVPGTLTRPTVRPSTDSSSSNTDAPTRPTTTPSISADTLRITKQPVSASAAVEEKVSFTVEIAGGKGPFTYQWQYSTDDGSSWMSVANSTKYSGVMTSVLKVVIDGTDAPSKNMIYRCKITDSAHNTLYSDSVKATYRRPTAAN